MKFDPPLIRGTLLKRYKRFMADIELEDGKVVTAHCANSGSMLSVNEPGAEVWVTHVDDPKRKLKYTWQMIKIGEGLVGINTGHPNRIVAEAIEAGEIEELSGYDSLKREQKYGQNSRIDILLEGKSKPMTYVEVKNVTMRRHLEKGSPVEFPDGVTARGTKHLKELADMVSAGHRAVMFYLVQRNDADQFVIAEDIDPEYAATLREVRAKGVETICYACELTPQNIEIIRPLTLDLP